METEDLRAEFNDLLEACRKSGFWKGFTTGILTALLICWVLAIIIQVFSGNI